MSLQDREYYEQRRQDCLRRAEDSSDTAIALVHRDLAARYTQMLAEAGAYHPAIKPLG